MKCILIEIRLISLLLFNLKNGKGDVVHVDYTLPIPGIESWFLFCLKIWRCQTLYHIK
jgi:hypothetical protein